MNVEVTILNERPPAYMEAVFKKTILNIIDRLEERRKANEKTN